MKGNIFKSLLCTVVGCLYVFTAHATVSLFSDYGQIQNVQNYSSNPFWSPNAPYNQRLPQPVYATGPDLDSGDCLSVVQSLVAAQCMARNNCANTDLSDIRPTIMVQLSNLPGHNYVSACSGYLDGVFDAYVKQYGNSMPNRPVAFPDSTTPNQNLNDSGGIQFNNPYKIQPTKWQQEYKERSDELQSLQRENGPNIEITQTDFPATYADLSFSGRMENDFEGLMPYKDMKAFRTLDVKTKEEWCADHPDYAMCKDTPQTPKDPKKKTYDICEAPIATLCVSSTNNDYSCVEGDTTILRPNVIDPGDFGILFSYGMAIGHTTTVPFEPMPEDKLQHHCSCHIDKFIFNQGLVEEQSDYAIYTGSVYSEARDELDIKSFCTQSCVDSIKENVDMRVQLLDGLNILHTSKDSCDTTDDTDYNIKEFNEIETKNLFNVAGSDYIAKSYTGIYTHRTPESKDEAKALEKNTWCVMFPYGKVCGSASCQSNECYGKVTKFTNNDDETKDIEDASEVPLPEEKQTYTTSEDCLEKCAQDIAYSTYYGTRANNVSWRKKLFFNR